MRSLNRCQSQLAHSPALSFGNKKTGNLILHGDNLQALKILAKTHRNAVRCVYLDPPYNNGESYNHYNDRRDSAAWLDAISQRIELIAPLMRKDGSLWISIDDREAHYLKVRADAILGRDRFVATVIWNQRSTRENRRAFSPNHEYIFVYAAEPKEFAAARNPVPPGPDLLKRFKNPDNDPRGPWQSISANVQDGHATAAQFYEIVAPNGRRHNPPKGRCWVYSKHRMLEEIRGNNVWFGKNGDGVPRLKRFLDRDFSGVVPQTIWLASEVNTTDSAKKHLLRLFPNEQVFDTPKPETLLKRILHIATNPEDLVLDPYLGSGTTAAVAHKMGRRYIGIEQGDHAVTLCAKRLRTVVEGDRDGISSEVRWIGGGGFDFFTLACGE